MLSWWGILYISLDAGLLVWALWAGDLDQRLAAALLLGLCLLSNISTFSQLGWGAYYPLMDLACGVGLAMVWMERMEQGQAKPWLLGMAGIFALMEGLHLVYGRGVLPAREYDWGLNGLQQGQGALLGVVIWMKGARE